MRTPLVLLFGSLLVGCTVGDPGPGGDDDSGGAVCGDGVKQASEECDGGSDCNADCTLKPVPKLDIRVDKPTIATELRTTHMVTATLIASGDYEGNVPLTASVVDAQGT